MINKVDQRLNEWVGTVIKDAKVSFAPPDSTNKEPLISVYLAGLRPSPPAPVESRRTPLQISLRYLISTWAETPEKSHEMLGTLVFAAMEHPEFEVELDPVPVEIWQAFGVPPCPSFMLRLPLILKRDEAPVPRIKWPPTIRDTTLSSLNGRIVDTGNNPVTGARVELPSLNLSTRADSQGRFSFAGVPAEPRSKEFFIKARGKELTLTLQQPNSEEELLLIRFDTLEA